MRLWKAPRITAAIIESHSIPDLSYEDIEYDDTAVERAVAERDRLRLYNVEPKAIVCGRRAFLSLRAWSIAHAAQIHPSMISMYATGDALILGDLPVYYVPGLLTQDFIRAVCGMDGIDLGVLSRSI